MTFRHRIPVSLAVIVLGFGVVVLWWQKQSPKQLEVAVFQSNLPTKPEIAANAVSLSDRKALAEKLDPRRGGWESEVFAQDAGEQLKKLAHWLMRSDLGEPFPKNILATEITLSELNPGSISEIYQNDDLTIRRLANTEGPLPMSTLGVDESIRLLGELGGVTGPETKSWHFKIVGVDLAGELPDTTVTVESTMEIAGNRRQQTALWQCRWATSEKGIAPRLRSIQLQRFEEADCSSGTWFRDCTGSVFAGVEGFDQQLARGLHHWLGRIDRAHGLNYFRRNGLAVGDANGDGLDDLYVCQPGGLPNRLFLQQRNGKLKDTTKVFALDWLDHTASALFVDLDNDGDQDLALATPFGVQVLENHDNAIFRRRATLKLVDKDLMSLSAADYDQDGDLDLFVCVDFADKGAHARRGRRLPGFLFHDARDGGKSVLFRNAGNWRFDDVTAECGMYDGNWRHSLAAAWEDYDKDGDLDLYLANDYGPNALYQNDRGRFTEVAESAGVLDYAASMSVTWGDANRDGWMDLYIGNMFSSAGQRISGQPRFMDGSDPVSRARHRRFAKGNSFFTNSPTGVFNESGAAAGVERGRWAWSSLFGDLNNDGWEDLFVANGYITTPDEGDL